MADLNAKPYFCPLMKEYFFKIESGEQDCEIRPNNHRGWNTKNIYPGRDITFSNGYGKHNRVTKQVTRTNIFLNVTDELIFFGIPVWHINAVREIYGAVDKWLVAYV